MWDPFGRDAAAHYIAGLCTTLIMVASPQRIVLGGGVLQRKTLVTKVRAHVKKQLGGYVQHDLVTTKKGLMNFIVTSRHGNDAGIVGAIALARAASGEGKRGKNKKKSWKKHALNFAFGAACAVLTNRLVEIPKLRRKQQ